jgi:hypothetical protein
MKTDIVKAIKFQLEDITCPVILVEVRLVRFPKYQLNSNILKIKKKEKDADVETGWIPVGSI